MGNVFCSGNEETTKQSSLLLRDASGEESRDGGRIGNPNGGNDNLPMHASTASATAGVDSAMLPDVASYAAHNQPVAAAAAALLLEQQQNQFLLQEQAAAQTRFARLIVQQTSAAMVAVRSTRGSTVYYDQGFAAALAQHLMDQNVFAASPPLLLAANFIPSISDSNTPNASNHTTKSTSIRMTAADQESSKNKLAAILSQPFIWESTLEDPTTSQQTRQEDPMQQYPQYIATQSNNTITSLEQYMDGRANLLFSRIQYHHQSMETTAASTEIFAGAPLMLEALST